MSFYDRYLRTCERNGIEPSSQNTADLIGTNRATISQWKTKGTMPSGTMVAKIADKLNTTTDYLLGRTDDPVDYTDPVLFQKRVAAQKDTQPDAAPAAFIQLYNQLDTYDQMQVEGFMKALLTGAKYAQQKKQA